MGADCRRLWCGIWCVFKNPRRFFSARINCAGLAWCGFFDLPPVHLKPVCAAIACAVYRAGADTNFARPGFGRASAFALCRICRLFDGLCFCAGRSHRERRRARLGAPYASVDFGSLGFSYFGHRARFLLGLLRTGLGRFLVLGSG